MKRRDFLKQGSGIAAGAVLGGPRLTRGATASGGGALPAWLRNAIRDGLGLYQWYKLDPDNAPGRPQSYWSNENGTGSARRLASTSETSDPDNDTRPDPVYGIPWRAHAGGPFGAPARRTHYSGPTLRRAGSVLLLHGGGHSNSWRNDVAEIHLGADTVLCQVITPPTPYDMIRFCRGGNSITKCPGVRPGEPKHFLHESWDYRHPQAGDPTVDRFHASYYLDGRPVVGHTGFLGQYNDENDVLVRFGSGVAIPGGGASNNVDVWTWRDRDWLKPVGYESPADPGSGMSRFGTLKARETEPLGVNDVLSARLFTQPMVKLVGTNRHVIVNDPARKVWAWEYPGPGFTVIGSMLSQPVLPTSYPTQCPAHDPVRQRLLWVINTGGPMDYSKATCSYIDLTRIGETMEVAIPRATYERSSGLNQLTRSDAVVFDEHNAHYLVWLGSMFRDRRRKGYAENPRIEAFNSAYIVEPVGYGSTPLALVPDPVYGLPPGIYSTFFRHLQYVPGLKLMAYVPTMPYKKGAKGEGEYGIAGGQYVWIFRVA